MAHARLAITFVPSCFLDGTHVDSRKQPGNKRCAWVDWRKRMPKMKLRVGVIGVGAIADEKHLPNWQELEAEGRVELIGV